MTDAESWIFEMQNVNKVTEILPTRPCLAALYSTMCAFFFFVAEIKCTNIQNEHLPYIYRCPLNLFNIAQARNQFYKQENAEVYVY